MKSSRRCKRVGSCKFLIEILTNELKSKLIYELDKGF